MVGGSLSTAAKWTSQDCRKSSPSPAIAFRGIIKNILGLRMYTIEVTNSGIRIYLAGEFCTELNGGNAVLIGLTFRNSSADPHPERGQDYLAGAIAALNHCATTQTIPAVKA